MIAGTIGQKIAEALKAHDEIRLSTLRLLSSALNYEKIAKQHDLTESEELTVLRREINKRQEAISDYEKAGASARAEKEKKELFILKEFLPEELSDEALYVLIENEIKETGAKDLKDMGKVIGSVLAKAKWAADAKKVAQVVRSKLS